VGPVARSRQVCIYVVEALLEARDIAKMKREKKRMGELMESGVGPRLYNLPEDRSGRWERVLTPYQTRRAGEGGHGAAKPDSIIHRCIFNPRATDHQLS
jgi:hypothetical protein